MMKNILRTAAIAVVAMLCVSCAKDEINVNPINPEPSIKYISASVSGDFDGLRTTLDGTKMSWVDGDAIGVYVVAGDGTKIQTNVQMIYNKDKNLFEGEFVERKIVNNANFYAYYPYNANAGSDPTKVANMLYPMQDGGVGGFDGKFDLMIATPITTTYQEPESGPYELRGEGGTNFFVFPTDGQAFATLKIVLPKFPDGGITIDGVKYDSSTEKDVRVSIISENNGATPAVSLAGNYTIDITNTTAQPQFSTHYTYVSSLFGALQADEERTFYLTCNPNAAAKIKLVVETTSGQYLASQSKVVALNRASVRTLKLSDWNNGWTDVFNLSVYGLANCYVAQLNSKYKFSVSKKGNGVDYANPIPQDTLTKYGATPLMSYSSDIDFSGNASDYEAVLVWEYNDERAIKNDSIIDDASVSLDYADKTISFNTGNQEGNALVALRKNGVIVWSWHVWVSKDAELINTGNAITSTLKIMDRNLGAIDNVPRKTNYKRNGGLYYQWGRKEPVVFGYGGDNNNNAVKQGFPEWGQQINSYTSDMIATAVENPTTAYREKASLDANSDTELGDWFTTDKNTSMLNVLWGGGYVNANHEVLYASTTKTMFDPCPAGYRMMVQGVWGNNSNAKELWNLTKWSADGGAYFIPDNAYYPASGQYAAENGTWSAADALRFWTATCGNPAGNRRPNFYSNSNQCSWVGGTVWIKSPNTIQPTNGYYKQAARPVRCIFDQHF